MFVQLLLTAFSSNDIARIVCSVFMGEVQKHDEHRFENLLVEFEVLVGKTAYGGDGVVGDPVTQPALIS